ncbi:hypothetical protein [Dongia sp.]|uniref:hypothetical protein n=1 Tax=Dongia sp. TaxID=1977262 RepID=UPI0035B063B0
MTDFLKPLGGRFIGMSGPVTPAAITGTVPDPPRSFLQVDPGTIIKGVVMGRENDGQITIATDKGTVRVASNAPLPPGTHVTLEVRPTGDRLQVLILANDAVRPTPAPSNSPQTPGAAQPPAAGTPAPPQPGQPSSPQAPGGSAPSTVPAPAGGLPTTGAPATGTPTTGIPATGTPPATTPPPSAPAPSIQIVGSTLPAIVLQSHAVTPPLPGTQAGQPSAPQIQIQLPNGQIVTLPQPMAAPPTTTVPTGQATPNPMAPGSVLPNPAGPAPIAVPSQAAAPPTATPLSTPAPMPISRPPLLPPSASALPGDVQHRILALFDAAPTHAALPNPGHPAMPAGETLLKAALPAGAELQIRVLAVQIGSQHPIEIDPAAQLNQNGKESHIVFGRVIAMTPAGHAVIHTPAGDILMQQRSSLPVGAQLALAIDHVEAPPPAPLVAAPLVVQTPQQALLSLSRAWPTLADLVAILQGAAPAASGRNAAIDPALAREILANLPHMGSRLGAGIVGAMAALRSGDIGRLLGSGFAARGLGPEREEIVRRLRGEFSQLSSLAQDRQEGEWRALFLPYLDDQQRVQRINLFYRRHQKGERGYEHGEGGTRFVVEAEFTRLGPFQLDGLMREHRFDLMIRSRQRVDERMRRDIESIYEEARGMTGFAGVIAFQTVDEFPVSPLEELKQGPDKVTI